MFLSVSLAPFLFSFCVNESQSQVLAHERASCWPSGPLMMLNLPTKHTRLLCVWCVCFLPPSLHLSPPFVSPLA